MREIIVSVYTKVYMQDTGITRFPIISIQLITLLLHEYIQMHQMHQMHT